jgi:hypothetical protein
MAHDIDAPVTETQGSMTQTIIWLGAMLVGLAVVAYFLI